jgi:hypothetical protein
MDDILKRAAAARRAVEPELLDRLAASLGSPLEPVRPQPPVWLLTCGLILAAAAIAIAGAARSGFFGVFKLSAGQCAVIFAALAIFLCLSAAEAVRERIPGSRRLAGPETTLAIGSAALLTVFASLFHDYHTDHFVHAGLACLATGVLHAIPAALAGWLIMRRGFAVNPGAAGVAAGTLAGLAGVTMLELHCANLQTLHIIVWHLAVLPVCAGAGALLAWVPRYHRAH